MSIIINKYNNMNYSKINTEAAFKKPSEEAIRSSMEEVRKYYIDTSGSPSLFQCFYLPFQLTHICKGLAQAKKTKNKEAVLDSRLKLFTLSVNSVYSFSTLAAILAQIQILFSHAVATISFINPITGIVASSITSAMEVRNIKRQYRFLSKCKESLKLLEAGKIDISAFDFLQEYIKNSSRLDRNLSRLANRVRPWFAEKIALELPTLLENIEQSDDVTLQKASLEKALLLVKDTKAQIEKKIVQQGICLLANFVLITAFLAVLTAQPYLIPIVLFTISLSLIISNYVFSRGTQDHAGWSFRPENCIPFRNSREGFLKQT